MSQVAIPVVAVTTMRRGDEDLPPMPRELARRMVDSMWLLLEPAGPVKNVEWPDRTDSTTRHYSALRVERTYGGKGDVDGGAVGGGCGRKRHGRRRSAVGPLSVRDLAAHLWCC